MFRVKKYVKVEEILLVAKFKRVFKIKREKTPVGNNSKNLSAKITLFTSCKNSGILFMITIKITANRRENKKNNFLECFVMLLKINKFLSK